MYIYIYVYIYIYTLSVDILNTHGSNNAVIELKLERPLLMILSQYDHMSLCNPI